MPSVLRYVVAAAFWVIAFALCCTAHAASATELVKRRQEAVFAAERAAPSRQHRQRVRQALAAMFDYDAMTQAVETSRWDALPAGKRDELRKLVRELFIHWHEQLIRTKQRDDYRVVFNAERQRGASVAVAATAESSAKDALPVDLVYVVEGSRIVDLRVTSLSLVRHTRQTIERKIGRNEVDEIMTRLRTITRAPVRPFEHSWQPTRPLTPDEVKLGTAVSVVMVGALIGWTLWWASRSGP
jgi:ABC-type transporter MlaC component